MSKVPHIAILDPETGERKWSREGLVPAAELRRDLEQFVRDNPWEVDGGHAGDHTNPGSRQKSYDEMTEEEQMAWVIEASLRDQHDPSGSTSSAEPEPAKPQLKRKASSSKPTTTIDLEDDGDEDFTPGDGDEYDRDADYLVPKSLARNNKKRSSRSAIPVASSDEEAEAVVPEAKRRKILTRNDSPPVSTSSIATSSASVATNTSTAPKIAAEPEPIPIHESEYLPEGTPDCTLQVRIASSLPCTPHAFEL